MANHGYVHTKGKFTKDGIDRILDSACRDVFRGTVTYRYDCDHGEHTWDIVSVCEDRDIARFQLWIASNRTVEFKHGWGGIFYRWIKAYIINQIGLEYNGWFRDDGVDGRWEPVLHKYDSLHEFIKSQYRHMGKPWSWLRFIMKYDIPKPIREKLLV